MIYDEEKIVGEKAKQMIETALLSKIGGAFKSHYKGDRDDKNLPLVEAKGFAGVKDWVGKQGDTISFLNKVVIRMSRHGFIQHYGIDNRIRRNAKRTRLKPKTTTYGFKEHYMNMKATPFLNEAVENSGIISYVTKEIAKIRGKQILVSTGKLLASININR